MKLMIIAVIFIGSCSYLKPAAAQLHVLFGDNIGNQPDWAPPGNPTASYYFMPDIDVYYDVVNHQYVFRNHSEWVHRYVLPPDIHFDKFNSLKVAINQTDPWYHNTEYIRKYRKRNKNNSTSAANGSYKEN